MEKGVEVAQAGMPTIQRGAVFEGLEKGLDCVEKLPASQARAWQSELMGDENPEAHGSTRLHVQKKSGAGIPRVRTGQRYFYEIILVTARGVRVGQKNALPVHRRNALQWVPLLANGLFRRAILYESDH